MSREEFIGKLQMVYVGDRNAFNDIVCAYDSVLSVNEKAVEYINDMLYPIGTCVNGSDLPYESIESLLNILQNGVDKN